MKTQNRLCQCYNGLDQGVVKQGVLMSGNVLVKLTKLNDIMYRLMQNTHKPNAFTFCFARSKPAPYFL